MKTETGVTRTEILSKLNLSVHGKLTEYHQFIDAACSQDPEFVAHLVAWDFVNGQIKDSKLAIPVITLSQRSYPKELTENSLAHLAMQPPRELLKALQFAITSRLPSSRQKALERMIQRYLKHKETEPGKWARLAIRHRRPLKSLYALTRTPAPEWASNALWGEIRGEKTVYVPNSVFADIANLSHMEPKQVAATIQKWHLSPLVVSGAMAGGKAKQEDSAVVQATMNQMSDTEVINRAASLERKGLSRDAALKETFRAKVSKATKSGKATLKTSVAAEEVEDEGLRDMLRELQERQIQAQKDAGRGIDGNWLLIIDKSQSMEEGIELGKHVSAAVAKFVSGNVYMAFCDETASARDVTGWDLDRIKQETKFVNAGGWTSIGVGLEWAIEKKLPLDGVAIISDGGENRPPFFADAYRRYEAAFGKRLPVYYYRVWPHEAYMQQFTEDLLTNSMKAASREMTKYDLAKGKIDYFSIPNLVMTMNASRFGVVEKIMAAPLVTIDQVLPLRVATIGR